MKKTLRNLSLVGILSILSSSCFSSKIPEITQDCLNKDLDGHYVANIYPIDDKSLRLADEYRIKALKKRELGTIVTYHEVEFNKLDLKNLMFTIENPTELDHAMLFVHFGDKCYRKFNNCFTKVEDGSYVLNIFDYSNDEQIKTGIPNDKTILYPAEYKNSARINLYVGKLNPSDINLKALISDIKDILNIPFSKEAMEVYDKLK